MGQRELFSRRNSSMQEGWKMWLHGSSRTTVVSETKSSRQIAQVGWEKGRRSEVGVGLSEAVVLAVGVGLSVSGAEEVVVLAVVVLELRTVLRDVSGSAVGGVSDETYAWRGSLSR